MPRISSSTSLQYFFINTLLAANCFCAPVDSVRSPVALILSGGGARGFAQIGVLKVLDEEGLRPDAIIGTSVGAIIGGLYAAGYSALELDSIARSVDWQDVLAINDDARRTELFVDQKQEADRSGLVFRLDGLTPVLPQSVSTGQRLTNLINRLTLQGIYHANGSFDNLKIPFRAIATDLISGKRKTLAAGDLAAAIRASATVPLRFTPIKRDSLILVDGGLISNLPADIADSLGISTIVAINTTSRLRTSDEINSPWDVADQIINLMMQSGIEKELHNATFVLSPELDDYSPYDFTRIDSLVASGEREARKHLEELRGLFRKEKLLTVQDKLREDIRLFGVKNFSTAALTAEVTGKHLSMAGVKERILHFYRSKGYSLARIDSMGERNGETNVYVNEGIVRSVRIEGNIATSAGVIRSEFPIDAGDVFAINDAERGVVNIASTGLFEQVLLEVEETPSHGEAPELFPRIILSVRERVARLARLGIHADNERYTQLGIQLADENIFGTGTKFSIAASGGIRNEHYEVRHRASRFFDTYLRSDVSVYYGRKDITVYATDPQTSLAHFSRSKTGEYSEYRWGARFSAGGQISRSATITVGGRIEEQRSSKEIGSQEYSRDRIVALKGNLILDTRDRSSFARSGSFIDGYYETGQQALGGTVGYTKLFVAAEQLLSWGDYTLRPHIELGVADFTLPLTEQFSLGGIHSFYGMREDEFRGRQMVEGSFEYRLKLPIKIYFDTYISARYDIGATWDQPTQVKLRSLRQGAGVALGLDTPIGPAEVAVGKSFFFLEHAAESVSIGPQVFYFSIGYPL